VSDAVKTKNEMRRRQMMNREAKNTYIFKILGYGLDLIVRHVLIPILD
jgi:hypothetical protein